MKYDFSGYATKNDILCSDGRTIRKDAFKDNDGTVVPLVWNHDHNDPANVLGHALLENRDDGVYAYCSFNDSDSGRIAKMLVEHGDINSLSIYANQLKQNAGDVIHGNIREVSLVLAGANTGARIDTDSIEHGDDGDIESAVIYHDADGVFMNDNDDDYSEKNKENEMPKGTISHADNEKTIGDVIDSMTDEQKNVLYALIGAAINGEFGDGSDSEEDDSAEQSDNSPYLIGQYERVNDMKHNIFDDTNDSSDNAIQHSDITAAISDAKRYGSMREAFEAHDLGDIAIVHDGTDYGITTYGSKAGNTGGATYGINNVDFLFPDVRNVTNQPVFIKRDTAWVSGVMSETTHTPFSRIRSVFADITEDDARARGYIKGKLKKEEVFTLLKRSTTPTTIYKKQKMDRDDVVDITDFDVIAWLKSEMRGMLDEEIARAILVGDGRLSSSDDKINEQNIRPIWTDEDLYTIKYSVPVDSASKIGDPSTTASLIDGAVRARKNYRGSGMPKFYTTTDFLTECLLLKDEEGYRLYKNVSELAQAMRVSEIVEVPVLENLKRTSGSTTYNLTGLIVNLKDYTVGSDRGGSVAMFDDFDIDYNQQKYLIETRCSGALTVPYSAIALETEVKSGPVA